MKMNEMFPSNFLKKEDIPYPTQAVIKSVSMEEINAEGGKETKAVVAFVGNLKPMILNKGNAEAICASYGDDSSAWHGKTVEIYVDNNVMFAGRRVGGLRIRIPDNRGGHQQNNGHAAPQFTATGFWDIADGTSKLLNQSTEQVQDFLADCKAPLTTVWIKPAGAPREAAKTADKWDFVSPLPANSMNDPIPF